MSINGKMPLSWQLVFKHDTPLHLIFALSRLVGKKKRKKSVIFLYFSCLLSFLLVWKYLLSGQNEIRGKRRERSERAVCRSDTLIYKAKPDPVRIVYRLRDLQRIKTGFIWNTMQQSHGQVWVIHEGNEELPSLERTEALERSPMLIWI